jgi:hypothetical protein
MIQKLMGLNVFFSNVWKCMTALNPITAICLRVFSNSNMSPAESRLKIIELYKKNVHGKKPDTSGYTEGHDGKEGHWLEVQMGIDPNGINDADIMGLEMKNDTTSKTTFGDWSADYYIFKDDKYRISRDEFLKIFGHPNMAKPGRFSWSGTPTPKIGTVNDYGQQLIIDSDSNIVATYSFSKDKRKNKDTIVPKAMQIENLIVARWDADSLKSKLERKFNQKGWFKCLKDKDGKYCEIVFGNQINYETWIEHVKNGEVFFDSGMYTGNPRHYSQWRANNSFWESLVVERYP